MSEIVNDLRTNGFAVLDGYISHKRCDRIRETIEEFLRNEAASVVGSEETDKRIFAAEYLSEEIREFKKDALLEQVARDYTGIDTRTLMVMANLVEPRPGVPIASGGLPHRDSRATQFKAMCYLTDVEPENGPFSILARSSTENEEYLADANAVGFDYSGKRWVTDIADPFFERVKKDVYLATAPRGTVIVFDSSLIHAGTTIEAGQRVAMTSYYYEYSEGVERWAGEKWTTSAGPIAFSA